jgi:hypothetical protein
VLTADILALSSGRVLLYPALVFIVKVNLMFRTRNLAAGNPMVAEVCLADHQAVFLGKPSQGGFLLFG